MVSMQIRLGPVPSPRRDDDLECATQPLGGVSDEIGSRRPQHTVHSVRKVGSVSPSHISRMAWPTATTSLFIDDHD
jgi:hypothetical protein